MIEIYMGTPLEKVLLFEDELRNIFGLSERETEAMAKRDALAKEDLWRDPWCLQKCMNVLIRRKFGLMLTYPDYLRVARSGRSETLINVWRQMEAV